MLVSAIVAIDRHRAIGKDNNIPWYLPADLRYFKRTTLHHTVIMGRKTFESIGRPLPKRTNIVLTRNPFFTATGVLMAHALAEALQLAAERGEEEAFVIGGGEIYARALPHLDRLYLTEVDTAIPDAEVFFPAIDPAEWTEIFREAHTADEKNPHDYVFRTLSRKPQEAE